MSKLFFDHLVVFEKVDVLIKSAVKNPEEKEELWRVVDELIHSQVLTCILERLPSELHNEFLEKYHTCPFDDDLIGYLNEKVEENIQDIIREAIMLLEEEILREIEGIE